MWSGWIVLLIYLFIYLFIWLVFLFIYVYLASNTSQCTVWNNSFFGVYIYDTQYTVKENTNITYVRVTVYTLVGLTFPLKAWFARSKVLLSAPLGILCEQHWQLRHHTGSMNQTSIFSPVSIYYPRKKKLYPVWVHRVCMLSAYYHCAYFSIITDKRWILIKLDVADSPDNKQNMK